MTTGPTPTKPVAFTIPLEVPAVPTGHGVAVVAVAHGECDAFLLVMCECGWHHTWPGPIVLEAITRAAANHWDPP